jgi:putative ABC transport system permease protein
MSGLRRFFYRLANVIRPNREEADFDREVASHLLLLEDECRRRGQSAEDARRSARLMLGGIAQTRELHREAGSFAWLDDARRDASYALRMLRRRPITATTAVLSLALGIGLNAAVFSVMDWVLLRPLPYPAPHELIRVFTAGTVPLTNPSPVTYSEFLTLGGATALRSSAALTTATRVMSTPGAESVRIAVARVCGDLSGTLGVYPKAGRAFSAAEMSAGAPVIILSHDLWLRRFSGDPTVAGRTVKIDGKPHLVIGVMPPGRGYPAGAEVWRPLSSAERADDDRELDMLSRLRSDVSAARASTEIATLARAASGGARAGWAEELQGTLVANVKTALQALAAAAALILLIVCANVAALVSAGGADRAPEIVIRGALGASRARVARQFVMESLILALGGGALGLLVGRWALRFLINIAPIGIPRLAEVTLDGRIAGMGLAATLLTGLAVGLAPAVRLSRLAVGPDPNHSGANRVTRRSNGRRALVLVQVAVAVVLTVGASLLARSLQHLVAIDNGFAADQLIAVDLHLGGEFEGDSGKLFEQLIAEASAFPGVASAAVSQGLPTRVRGFRAAVQRAGEASAPQQTTWRPVGPGYFETAGIPIVAGRSFTRADTARSARVAIVNRAFLRALPTIAVGERLTTDLGKELLTIVGVAGDVTPAGEPDRPAFYVSVAQYPIGGGSLLIRTRSDPRASIPGLIARLRGLLPGLATDRVHRVAESLEAGRAVIRFTTVLASTFAGLALLLSAIGVYGLVAGEVSARWRELAVRLAVGASHGDTLWTVIRPCAAILGGGSAIGVLGALSAGPALQSLLHGVTPADPYTLAFAPALLGLVGMMAAVLAAARVLRADPASTLRSE